MQNFDDTSLKLQIARAQVFSGDLSLDQLKCLAHLANELLYTINRKVMTDRGESDVPNFPRKNSNS